MATSFIARRALSSATPAALARPFTTSTALGKVPSIADIHPQDAPKFNAKQAEFRSQQEQARKLKKEQDSTSQQAKSPFHKSASSSHSPEDLLAKDSAPGAAAAAQSEGVVGDLAHKLGLGSLSGTSGKDKDHRLAQDAGERQGTLGRIIYGTPEGRELDREIERSFSQVLARGKYVHSIVFHKVKPECVDEYTVLIGSWYPKVANNPQNHVHLVGSWRTEVGDCDTFVHIWEYERYTGYHKSLNSIQKDPGFAAFDAKLKQLIISKDTSLMQEFSFWPTTAPRQLGGIFELRSYTLNPGNLLEWEQHWRNGLKARREVMEGVGAWFVQIGQLNTVHHLWQFADLEERRVRREMSWGIEGWSDTVHKTVPLIQDMKSRIMIPCSWSPTA